MKKIYHFLSSIKREVHKRKLVPFFCLMVHNVHSSQVMIKRDSKKTVIVAFLEIPKKSKTWFA